MSAGEQQLSDAEIHNRLTAVLNEFPAFFSNPSPKVFRAKKGRPTKIPALEQRELLRLEERYTQRYPLKLNDFLEQKSLSLAEYIRTYKNILKKPQIQKQVFCPTAHIVDGVSFNVGFGNSYFDFSKVYLPLPAIEEMIDEVKFSIYIEQRMIFRLLDICIALGETAKSNKLSLRGWEYFTGKLDQPYAPEGSTKVVIESPSPFQIFSNRALLRTLLCKREYFLIAAKIEPCLLQTNFGHRNLSSFSLLEDEIWKTFFADRKTKPLWETHLVKRALLLFRLYEPDLTMDYDSSHKDILLALETGKVVPKNKFKIGNLRKIFQRMLV